MINAGEYNKRISVWVRYGSKDEEGFPTLHRGFVMNAWAKVKTTRGYTLIANNSDFEKVYTNFTIRYPKFALTRDMEIKYNDKYYSIEYLNNIDEANVELEIQAKLVDK